MNEITMCQRFDKKQCLTWVIDMYVFIVYFSLEKNIVWCIKIHVSSTNISAQKMLLQDSFEKLHTNEISAWKMVVAVAKYELSLLKFNKSLSRYGWAREQNGTYRIWYRHYKSNF